jgi:spore coat protein U-like protein
MTYANALKSVLSAAVLGCLALGLASTPAVAQTNPATATFGVSATVLKDCIVSATAMAFGNYTGAVNNATSTVTVTCTSTTTYTVGLSAGLATGATVTTRQMAITQPAGALNYGLFTNATWTTNWGNTSATNWVSGTGNGAAQPLTVYGQIPANQYVTPGSYTDTITATVTY